MLYIARILSVSLLVAGMASAQPILSPTSWASPQCAGSAIGDFDNDGWPDVFRTACRQYQVALMHNEGDGVFSLAAQNKSIQDVLPNSRLGYGQSFADYDNDGDLDLFIPVGMWDYNERSSNRLLRNDRGIFNNVTAAAGLIDTNATDNIVWFDYDRDGHLDIYMGNPNCDASLLASNILYRNRGNGTFEDVTEKAGLSLVVGGIEEGDCPGSNGGMAAADFDDDGWPDLYIGFFRAPNRLLLNDGQGGFRDATTSEIADPGEAFDVAVGDFDNDGDLDIFQAAGGVTQTNRSLFLLNLGAGEFLDTTEGLGISLLGNTQDTGSADIDNDGDLDLFIGGPPTVFLNNGDGTFEEATTRVVDDVDERDRLRVPVLFADFNRDGALDGQDFYRFFHNNGTDQHYLQVELVGVESNRNGIGARLLADSGDLRQMREILGGRGFNQDELVAHFGLGGHERVERLEISWPSGQVDVFTDLPADQHIRVFEGRDTYHAVQPTVWEEAPVVVLVTGKAVEMQAIVRPALFEADARIVRVAADLSAFGGPAEVPLVDRGDGTYQFAPIEISAAEGTSGFRPFTVKIDQETSLGPYWIDLTRQIAVLPGANIAIFGDVLHEGWMRTGWDGVSFDPAAREFVFAGESSLKLQTPNFWAVGYQPIEPVNRLGYRALRFAFHPGDATVPARPFFRVLINGSSVTVMGRLTLSEIALDMEVKDWQVVEIPLDAFIDNGPITAIAFSGNVEGTFYLDEVQLVTETPTEPTAVLEEHADARPQIFALEQNFPNPFNSGTVIRFALPQDEEVELTVFNLAGQKAVTLVEGARVAGAYAVNWDGRDGGGRALATGLYLYRLRVGGRVETRKLLLLR